MLAGVSYRDQNVFWGLAVSLSPLYVHVLLIICEVFKMAPWSQSSNLSCQLQYVTIQCDISHYSVLSVSKIAMLMRSIMGHSMGVVMVLSLNVLKCIKFECIIIYM